MEDNQATLKYRLAHGSQVREEDFGLLFYTKSGPRLFFVSSGDLVGCDFFCGDVTLAEWIKKDRRSDPVSDQVIESIARQLDRLCERGVLLGF